MLSNNTTYKLRSSKTSSEICNYEQSSAENGENNVMDWDFSESNNRSQGYLREGRFRNSSSRSRITEFRPSTWTTDRKGFKSRGTVTRNRNEREGLNSFRKYHDSTSRSADNVGNSHHGKFYENEKKTELKLNLPEDTRISKLLRRLSMETDQNNSLVISKKLLEVLLLPDNAPYIRKAFHILGESMFEILQVSPGLQSKKQAARALGRMGYIMGQENDFERYQNWLFGKMSSSYEDMQVLFMESLKETLTFEMKLPVIQEHVDNLFRNLVSIIENTESAPIFKITLDVLMTVVEIYHDNFFPFFRDTIDLLFGWHVDHTQPLSTIEFISKNLQRIPKHFQFNLEFSLNLIENFLEDIVNYSKQLSETSDSSYLEHITVLVLAMNTILKCLDKCINPNENKVVRPDLISSLVAQIIKTTSEALESYIPENLTIATNDCVAMLLTFLDTKTQTLVNSVYNLIESELSLVNEFTEFTIVSMLIFISKILKELSANLPVKLIEKLVGPKSELMKLRTSPFLDIQKSVILVYQALLNLKNVSLVQEAYRYVLGDFETIYRKILPSCKPFTENNPFNESDVEKYSERDAENSVIFLLRCLSQLANASSIIVMWALKPSILELVAVHLLPYDQTLAQNYPDVQFGLMYLLFSHCRCYNHYISTSSLLSRNDESSSLTRFSITDGSKDDVPHSSPNSGNFTIILDVIYKTLNADSGHEVVLLTLKWIKDVLCKSEAYLINIYNKENFVSITEVLVRCGYNLNQDVALHVCENLDKLLSYKHLPWSNTFLINVSDLCKLHMSSNKKVLRSAYSKLASLIPWDVAVVEFNKVNSVNNSKHQNSSSKDYNSYMITMAQYLHSTGAIYNDLCSSQFKKLMKFLLDPETDKTNIDCLEEIFVSSLCLDLESQMNMELFHDLGTNSKNVLHNWATLEAAQFCVNSKLRTPLGKPNETFMKIEGALNTLGNELLTMNKDKTAKHENRLTRIRVSLLLKFIEHLEKRIYNAAEGCAIAMPQPPKLVRTFFIANFNTCNEWITRIRMVIIHIALHAGEFNAVIRHTHALMKEMVTTDKIQSAEFERCAIFLTMALLNLRETEAIYGLYVWCKNLQGKHGRKYGWIKYAGEQSSKKYETAIEGYRKILQEMAKTEDDEKEEDMEKINLEIRNFIHDQVEACLKEFHHWFDILTWHKTPENEEFNENHRKCWYYSNDWECATSFAELEGGIHELSALSEWNTDDKPKSWSCYNTLSTAENNLYRIALQLSTNRITEDLNQKIDLNLSLIENSIQEYLDIAPCEIFQTFCLLQYIGNGLKNVYNNIPANTVFLVSENFETEVSMIDSSILRKILWWSEYFGSMQNQGFNSFCSNLRLDIINRARKEKNFNLAYRQIYKFLEEKDLILSDQQSSTNNLAVSVINKISDVKIWTMDTARAVSEVIKLLYTKEDNKQDIFNLCAATSSSISKHTELYGGPELRRMSSKILLKLASWMQNNDISVTDVNSHLGKLLLVLPDIGLVDNNPSGIIPLNEMAIGKLLQFSVHQCVTLAKGWSSFGTWCYKWGRKILDHGHSSTNSLTEDDCNAIKSLLPEDTNEEEILEIFKILSQNRNITDEEDLDSNSIKTSFMIKNQLQNIRPLQNAEDDYLEQLLLIWRNTQKRIYNYYNLSAEAYFKYLHLLANSENISKSMECTTITITLRLLRLIVRYALELQGTLEEGLKATPTQPWKVIIPQLFSRLNHPESYVHHCVSDLLCRVAEDAPHLITFPAVVGALEGGVKFNFSEITLPKDCLSQVIEKDEDDDLNENEDDESDVEEVSSSLQSSFKVLVDTLSKQDPETIAQVQLLVRELRRITLLWDELWLGTLLQHSSEITKREQQLEYEIEKVMENPNLSEEEKISLIAEKHRIIIKPIIFVLEQLREVTNVEPETPHEKMFKEKFSAEIDGLILKLKQPDHPEKPHESLLPLKNLQKKFQQKIQKRSSYSLKMQDISPILANIRDTMIAMPGLTSSKTPVTISHVSNVVSILPTKTKPKKLVFYGSDGQTYTYLFKGLEDLHLDERIMQFLNIANTMMAQNVDPTGQNLYRARHYSVIPLGPRSGLISWVEGTTPVFSLYKRWQQRELAKPSTKNASATNAVVLRPSELFYNKLNPLLVEHGVKNVENRKEWPLSALKQVLTELMAETPSDLLAKELWCNSISASDWWNVTKRYSYSVAVMSIIGYIIGLGDRHLDNVLVDLTSGEVVHIDYNVCFEKGKTLRVPEKVPFRLTPNIRDALGVTGIEGIFRLACENVLKTMRKGRETLLTLLEAFVYDPLIDWTVGAEVLAGATFGNIPSVNNIKQSRKELEKEVTISMFNVRCTEMKTEWNENKDEILKEISILREKLDDWLKVDKVIFEEENALQDLHQQMALVKEAEAHTSNKHPLHTLPSRFDTYHKTKDALKNAKKDVQSLKTECQDHLDSYNECLTTVDGPDLLNWLIDLKNVFSEDNVNVFDLVKEFLHNAGKDDVVSQCEESENEIAQLTQHQNASIQKCLQLLQEYKTLIGQCPRSFIETHRTSKYLKLLTYMLENDSPAACDRVYENFHNFLDNPNLSTNALNFKVSLDNFYKETLSETNKLYEELSVSSADIQTLDNLYTTARAGITTFLSCEKNADKAFEFVIALELLVMNRNFLTLETAAHRSGEWLIKLTSRDGDWFLDDLVLNSSRAVELMNNLPLVASEEHILFFQVFNCVRISNNIYRGLQELYFNFHTIILPESMKKIQSEDESLKQIITDLNNLLKGVGMSIPEMTTQLVKMLPCLLMQMEIGTFYDFVLERVSALKTGFLALINGQSETLTSGRMLLMGFNGLFEKLTMEWNDLINALGSINLPNSWKKVDQVKGAKNISPHVCNSKVHSILEDIFLLKRLQAMSDFFNCCSEMCESFKGTTSVAYNDDHLLKPIRQFIADFISKQLLGITTEHIAYVVCYLLQDLGFDVSEEIEQKDIGAESKVPLDDLYHKAGNVFLKQGLFSQNALSQASTLESNLKHAWIKIQETKKLQRKITLLQSTQVRLHTQLTMVNFMFEEILASFNLFTPVRSKFILDLKTEFTTLQLVNDKLRLAGENQKALIESARQRLKWAKGANPEVGEISSAFENSVQVRENHLRLLEEISTKIIKISGVILKHEVLRNHCMETKNYDKTFLTSYENWRVACQYKTVKSDALTPTEESIMSLLTKELTTNPKWLEKISEMITVLIGKTQGKLTDEKANLFTVIDTIMTRLEILKNAYNTHCRLMTDVKNLVKSMTKIENYTNSTQEFIAQYRTYIENFSLIFQKFKKEHKREDVLEVINCLNYMEDHTKQIYEDLLELEDGRKKILVRQDAVCPETNTSLQKQESIAMKGQQRNAYAVSVWRRVKMKLEGRDPDPGRKCSAQEQVDYVIREATSLDNLALLYEGWTPWV